MIPRSERSLRCYGLASTVVGLVAAVRVGIVTLNDSQGNS
jgi:hypothetical protein